MIRLLFLFTLLILYNICLHAQKPDSTLPVELVYFDAYLQESSVLLLFGTATEINNYGFDIERADSNKQWEFIGFVPGHGTSFSPKDYSFEDTTILLNGIYFYRLKQIDNDGGFEYSDEDTVYVNFVTFIEKANLFPVDFILFQNYPNPFNPATKIKFIIPVSENNSSGLFKEKKKFSNPTSNISFDPTSDISSDLTSNIVPTSPLFKRGDRGEFTTLKIYDILGNEIATLLNEQLPAGEYEIIFSPDQFKNNLAGGVYFYRLISGDIIKSKKMIYLK